MLGFVRGCSKCLLCFVKFVAVPPPPIFYAGESRIQDDNGTVLSSSAISGMGHLVALATCACLQGKNRGCSFLCHFSLGSGPQAVSQDKSSLLLPKALCLWPCPGLNICNKKGNRNLVQDCCSSKMGFLAGFFYFSPWLL